MSRVTVETQPDHVLAVTARARQHTLVSDESIEDGGDDLGPNPHELLLAALGSCIVMTLHLYSRRKQWPLESVQVELDFSRQDEPRPEGGRIRRETITRRIALNGPLTEPQRERLMQIAARCPVHRTLTEPPTIVDELIAGYESDSTSEIG